jgi:hypothetical protein
MKLKIHTFNLFAAIAIFLTMCGSAGDNSFVPTNSPFRGDMFWSSLIGCENGAEVLRTGASAAFLKLERHHVTAGYSFIFDEKLVKSYASIDGPDLVELYSLLQTRESYGTNKIAKSKPEKLEDWDNQVCVELANGETFLRIYFIKSLDRCEFVSSTGQRSNKTFISPALGAFLRKISNDPNRAWIKLR